MRSKSPSLDWLRRAIAWLIVAGCLGTSAQGQSQPVVLYLRNGDRITGIITAESTNGVTLATAWANGVVVPLAEIMKRQTAVVLDRARADELRPPAGPANVPEAITNSVSTPITASAPPVQAKPVSQWTGDVQLGLDLAFSEKDRQTYSGRSKVAYTRERVRNIFDYAFSYGTTDGVLSANRMDGAVKTDFELGRRVYIYNLLGAGYDEIRRINVRYDLGPGLGYHVLKLKNFALNAEFGVNYQVQHLADNTRTELFYYRWAEDFTWNINHRFTLDEKIEFFPRVEDWGKYRLRFEANLRYWLFSNLSLNLTAIDQYDTQPARAVPQNDLQLRSSIGVKF